MKYSYNIIKKYNPNTLYDITYFNNQPNNSILSFAHELVSDNFDKDYLKCLRCKIKIGIHELDNYIKCIGHYESLNSGYKNEA